jgi:carbamoyl-phosphate synthase small subunit
LDDWFKKQGIVGLEGIDTRALTRHIREAGSMNGILTTSDESDDVLKTRAQKAPHMQGMDLVRSLTCGEISTFNPALGSIGTLNDGSRNSLK